jgi:hypothetical protein
MSAVILPTYVAGDSSPDSYSSATPAHMVDGSGLSEAIPAGDTLTHALGVTHLYDGVFESWVTMDPNGGNSDYYANGTAAPLIVLDLGAEQSVGTIILWQYQNNGGSNATDGARDGNHTRTIDVRFNTAADGSSNFAGSPTTVTLKEVWLGLGGVNSAQAFAIPAAPTARYVQLAVTDNYYGQPGINAGGDRVGLGEVRFATEVVPELSSALLGALGLLGLLRRRR